MSKISNVVFMNYCTKIFPRLDLFEQENSTAKLNDFSH